MSLDPSIENVGEYYSSHYLATTFSNDVKELIAGWRRQGADAVPRRVQQLSRRYFGAKAQALEEDAPAERWRAGDDLSAWHSHLLEHLGYTERTRVDIPVEGAKTHVPAAARIHRYSRPWLVICETVFRLPDAGLKDGMAAEDPLEMEPLPDQLTDGERPLCGGPWGRLIQRVFTEEDAPRWVMVLAGSQVLLLDKHTFAQGRWLAFDLDDAYGRGDRTAFDHAAAFLSAETLCPDGESGDAIHDRLEKQSHRFAHGVTENLQAAVREAIHTLAREWVEDRRRRNRSFTRRMENELLPDGSDGITAEHLKHEALIFVYRLLFCFYAEARGGELGILPITDDLYRHGYSLESLRDLEQVPLTAVTEAGIYFHRHLTLLFDAIHQGVNLDDGKPAPTPNPLVQQQLFPGREPERAVQMTMFDAAASTDAERIRKAFTIRPLTATLFEPSATPLLNNARLTNRCLQAVIRHLSLSRDESRRSIGRVNYAELGIHQLGAVYEGLLSYKGMFAEEDLIQVKAPRGTFGDKNTPTWFVPASRIEEFRDGKNRNIVERLEDGKPRIYKKGEFILHLSGIDREQSASYYTPLPLTQCTVAESLRELLKDVWPADADRLPLSPTRWSWGPCRCGWAASISWGRTLATMVSRTGGGPGPRPGSGCGSGAATASSGRAGRCGRRRICSRAGIAARGARRRGSSSRARPGKRTRSTIFWSLTRRWPRRPGTGSCAGSIRMRARRPGEARGPGQEEMGWGGGGRSPGDLRPDRLALGSVFVGAGPGVERDGLHGDGLAGEGGQR